MDLVSTHLGRFTGVANGELRRGLPGQHTATVQVQGTGSVSCTVLIKAGNSETALATVATITATGTDTAVGTGTWGEDYQFWRADVTAISGTSVRVDCASDVDGGGADTSSAQFKQAVRNIAAKPASSAMFILPGRQFPGSGSIKDISGNSADASLQAGITDAQMWASNGYYSGVAAANGRPVVPNAKSNFDLSSESVIFATVLNAANPAAAQSVFGNAAAGFNGFYLSLRVGGAIRPVVITPAGNYNGLADSAAIFGDGTDHHLLVAFDATTGEIKLYRDGVLCNAYAAGSYGRTGGPATPTTDFGLLGGPGAGPGYAIKGYGTQLYRKAGGLPLNLSQIAAKLSAAPASYLTDADLDW